MIVTPLRSPRRRAFGAVTAPKHASLDQPLVIGHQLDRAREQNAASRCADDDMM